MQYMWRKCAHLTWPSCRNWEKAEPICSQPKAGCDVVSLVFNPLNCFQLCALGTASITVWNIEKSTNLHVLKPRYPGYSNWIYIFWWHKVSNHITNVKHLLFHIILFCRVIELPTIEDTVDKGLMATYLNESDKETQLPPIPLLDVGDKAKSFPYHLYQHMSALMLDFQDETLLPFAISHIIYEL